MVGTGETRNLPENVSLESTARTSDIFVFCTSTQLSTALAREFQSDICIEIVDEVAFTAALRAALARRPRVRPSKPLLRGPVSYYDSSEPPIVDWALPDHITMSKPNRFQHQCEYRFAFAVNDAFRVHETTQVLTTRERSPVLRAESYTHDLLKLGDLHRITHVHQFNIAAA
jgi:hypothetical protein